MAQTNLRFKVGQTLEVRSFEDGYRGAWLRCEILNIYTKEGKLF
ncbi:BnaC03g15680D [Brassica napus]|uniref:BnaC03g15680D protein n=2 Tax=Brassica TaxID=3705 RepID=A0A078H1S5_BRANA|nr:BnaC03g15680D [Brassica napus]VDC88255.1 unnamed protein product [Brassica oleracea]